MPHSDTQMLPPQIEAVLQEVQARANYMPPSQLDVRLFVVCRTLMRDMLTTSNAGCDEGRSWERVALRVRRFR